MSVNSGSSGNVVTPDILDRRESMLLRLIVIAAILVALAAFAGVYYKRTWQRLDDRNAMDIAQVGRNLAEGRGYTTRFVRPLNAALLPPAVEDTYEVNHAPLAPLMAAVAFRLKAPNDETAAQVSLLFTILTVFATCALGWRLFDWRVGVLSASAVGLSMGVLETGVSGTEWPMATFWFSLLLIALALHHSSTLADSKRAGTAYAALSGALAALLYLTNHVLAVLVIPVALYFAFTGPRRKLDLALFLVVVAVIASPWAYRNLKLTGFPILGISAWDMMADTEAFPGDTLYRSTADIPLQPLKVLLFPLEHFGAWARKLGSHSCELLSAFALTLGLAVASFAVVSTLYRFKKPTANAVRGAVYAIAPLVLLCFALFGIQREAVVILVPIASVLGSAYFLLLLDAKKVHPFFYRALVAAFVAVTAYQAVVEVVWPASGPKVAAEQTSYEYFQRLGANGIKAVIFTDKPWEVAWRTLGTGVWLPRTDGDVSLLSAKGFRMEGIVLTHESGDYSPDEIWYHLHRVRAWREYIRNPKAALAEVLNEAGVDPQDAVKVDKFLQRLKRQFAVSQSLRGFTVLRSDPLSPDDLQILVLRESVEQ